MNRGKLILLLVLLAAAIVTVVWLRALQNPVRQVEARFVALAELVSKSGDESPIQMVVKAQTLQEFFTDPAELLTPVSGLSGQLSPNDIASQTMAARGFFRTAQLRFRDLRITCPDRQSANATVTVQLSGDATSGDRVDEIRELQCALKRVDGKWRFSACAAVDVLER